MKKLLSRFIALTSAIIFLCLPISLFAQEPAHLNVDVSSVCIGVTDLEPVGTGVSFPVTVGKLYCFTRIIGALTPTQITHVWYFGATERARVNLAVNASRWRTYSSKMIQPHEVGSWRVEVLDSEGTELKVIQFITTEASEVSPPTSQPDIPIPEEVPLEETTPKEGPRE